MNRLAAVAVLLAAALAAASACEYQLNTEYPRPQEEAEAFKAISAVIGATQKQEAQAGEAMRFFHAKSSGGCARGRLTVLPDVQPVFRHGVFATPGKTYDVVTRFSNGLTTVNPDTTPDTRGFAMQVLNVPGERLLAHDKTSVATFISAAYPSFLVPDAATLADQVTTFAKTGVTGGLAKAAWLASHPRTAVAITKTLLMGHHVEAFAGATFWSQTPYRLGPNQAIHFKFEPCLGSPVVTAPGGDASPNYLREAMDQQLNVDRQPMCFVMMVQRQEDACKQPIEDSMVEWETDWWPVAQIVFSPNQDLDSPQARANCENAEYNPWISTVDHQPLGINRFRKMVYPFSSGNRHALNNAPVHEW